MAVDALAGKLLRLLEDGSIPVSGISRGDYRRLRPLLESGVIEEERAGGGRRLAVRNGEAVSAFIRKHYPAGIEGSGDEGLPPRSRAVAVLRDAKKARGTDAEPVLLRGFGDAELTAEGHALPVAEWCRAAGVAAIRLDNETAWSFTGTLAVMENLEVFLHFERLHLPADIVCYAAGRISERMIGWLSSPGMARCRIIHCGDYDPVGLDEYLRMKTACPGRVELYVPGYLDDLFSRYGNPKLLARNNSTAILARLRKSDDPAVRHVVELMDRCGGGLEQEALLVRE